MTMSQMLEIGLVPLPEGFFYRISQTNLSLHIVTVEIREKRFIGSTHWAEGSASVALYANVEGAILVAGHKAWQDYLSLLNYPWRYLGDHR